MPVSIRMYGSFVLRDIACFSRASSCKSSWHALQPQVSTYILALLVNSLTGVRRNIDIYLHQLMVPVGRKKKTKMKMSFVNELFSYYSVCIIYRLTDNLG